MKNNKAFFLLRLFLWVFGLSSVQAQEISDRERIALLSKELSRACQNIRHMQCHYLYEKKISLLEESICCQGEVSYCKPTQLFWSVTAPQHRSFLMKNDSIHLVSDKETQSFPMAEHPLFGEIAKLMQTNEQQSSLIDEKIVHAGYYEDEHYWIVRLKPLKSRLKKVLGDISLYFDAESKQLLKIEITDSNKDLTYITLSDIRIRSGQ